ncbi:tail sheath [Halorubrum tailed virus 25]|uniref:Tail sheath n=1 Tax=Halorubrum tailed virus 25 TaxID=2878006 RepID=A0AAE8XYV5_9CAUD|nr:tail sheath [Halorubrum tailed virus 25]UBF22604.1 tail sheath [Halorubrum tailed virus 25]
MVTIGSTTLPGVQADVESATSTGVNVGAAAQVGLVGQADLANGTANANEVYEVTTSVKARTWFGDGSPLAKNCIDALTGGAYPVYAVAPEQIEVTNEDLSGLGSTSGTLANSPGPENASEYTFLVDGAVKDAVLTMDDPSTKSPGADEVYVNPVTGDFELDVAPSTSGEVDYSYFDYPSATAALYGERGEVVDLVGLVNENDDVVSDALSVAEEHATRAEFTTVVAGAAPRLDASSFTNSFDTSRLQLLYPSRNAKDESIIGSYLGLRATLGINNSPIWKRLSDQRDLAVTLSKFEQEALVSEKVVPVADESRGARIVEDLTCVADSNAEEDAMRQVLHRLIVDYVTEVVYVASERFIGELHTRAARNALSTIIGGEMDQLLTQNSITDYTVTVEKVDAMTASVDVGIDTIDPLRNILATIAAGEVQQASA